MRISYITNSIGLILTLFGMVILFPIIFAIVFKEYSSITPFLTASLISILTGFLLRLNKKEAQNFNDLKKAEGLFIVVLTWLSVAVITSIPYLFYDVSIINAFFEAISGTTTTGATIFTDFSLYPKTLFLWRSMSQWLGGLGIIVLFIAILPQFAVAGRQLFFAEAPGPTEEKITPRVRSTATALWSIYIALTIIEIISLQLAGMHLFDAICNSFSTLAAGGFSPNPQSIMGYNSSIIEWIIIIFMFLAGASFVLQYKAITMRKPKLFWNSSEFRTYFLIVAITSLILCGLLFANNYLPLLDSFRTSLFQVVSIITTTGFASVDFELWSVAMKITLFSIMLIGGCAGSAGGGIKVVRILLSFKHMKKEIAQTLHPKAVIPIKLDRTIVPPDILRQIIVFILFYLSLFILSSLVVSAIEGNIVVGITGTAATIGNIGPGFGSLGPMASYNDLSIVSKLIFCFNMLVGRLELIPFLVMLHPDFWNFKK
ncbi:MAG: TrkH family potassium uptake protein [Candidatus Gastranaerophilales bacterium]|nr:TrkH family potassium uptake protein [Candidatus Gastranaerophilales bacterium]